MRLVYLSLSWVLGNVLSLRYAPDSTVVVVLLGICALLSVLFFRNRKLLLAGFCLIFLLCGMLRFGSIPDGDGLEAYRGYVTLQGVIGADPDVRDYSTALQFEARSIQTDGQWQDVSGTAMVYAPRFPDLGASRDFPYYRYGDLIQIEGVLESPTALEDFDFKDYLARQGIYSMMTQAREVTLIDAGHKPKMMAWIYGLRRQMSQSLDEALSEPHASLAKAMLLGQRSSISPSIREDFSRTGTSHLLAISGLHVSIIAGLALSAGVWLFGRQRPTYFLLALGVIWLYVMLTGMGASAFRAGIMGSLWLYADRIGRPRSAFTVLTLAGAIMLAVNPRLLTDVGFQLSFAAMAGLVFLTPIFQTCGSRVCSRQADDGSSIIGFIVGSFAVTLGAVIATAPLIGYYFGIVSVLCLPASLLTLPAVPGIIITASLTGILGMLSSFVADVCGWGVWLLTSYLVKTVGQLSDIPFASFDIEVSAAGVWGSYGALAMTLWLPGNRHRMSDGIRSLVRLIRKVPASARSVPAKWLMVSLLLITIGVGTAHFLVSDNRLHIYVLDVGQGDAVLISRGNTQILIDGGPSAAAISDSLGGKLPFWDRSIELVVLTHPDSDHITGLVEVIKRYKVEQIVTSGQEIDSDVYREWRKLIAEKGIPRVTAQAGQHITFGQDIELAVLSPENPPVKPADSEINENSVVLRLQYQNFTMLLTGDMETETEKRVLDESVPLQSTLLKVAHHGSNTGTSAEFLDQVKPMFAAISVGADNTFGHPKEEIVDRLKKMVGSDGLLLTSERGTIEFVTDGETLWIDE